MGLEIISSHLGEMAELAIDVVSRPEEKYRKERARRRVQLYRDDYAGILRDHLNAIFNEPAIRNRFEPYIALVGGSSFLKRICDELARPLYARSPQRRIIVPGQPAERSADGSPLMSQPQMAWNAMAAEMELDERMDIAARLLIACNRVFLFCRYVDGHGMCCDVMTPNQVSVIPDPRRPHTALAVIYEAAWDSRGAATRYVVWDDKRYFSFDHNTRAVGAEIGHDFGLIPIVELRRRGHFGSYWDHTTGSDLEAATLFSMLLDLICARKLKTQSHIQLAFSGDTEGFTKDQVSDEESVLITNGSGNLSPIDLQSDPSAILKAKEVNETTVAANYGISRERLNQNTGSAGEDVGLKERVSELAQALARGEHGVFKVCRAVCREHPVYRGMIPDEAIQVIDLGQIHNRVDRATELSVFREEMRLGRKSIYDGIFEDNPEYGGDEGLARAHLLQKTTQNQEAFELLRSGNIGMDNNAEEPGQSAKKNGAMGPAVRDGKKTRDEAAKEAVGGIEHGGGGGTPTTPPAE